MPRAPLHEPGVTSLVVVSQTTSTGITLLSSLIRAHAPVLTPPAASVVSSDSGSVQVAVSPCWEEDLPDVFSAHLSLRAWTPTPAARVVPVPVSSHTTAAFPSFGPGRRSTQPVQRFQYGALFPGRAAGYPDGSPTDPDECDSYIRFLGITASLRRSSARPWPVGVGNAPRGA